MKKKNTKNKPHNKWKIIAIISLVINALVVLLLVVGLATPKAKYLSVNAQSDDATAYIYKNSNDINPTQTIWTTFVEEVNGYDGVNLYPSSHMAIFTFDNYPQDYLTNNNQLTFVHNIVFWFANSVSDNPSSAFLLKGISFNPMEATGGNYYVYLSTWTDAWASHSESYDELGVNSPYCYLPYNMDTRVKEVLYRYFICIGDNSVIDQYLITDNFNPNKYISMTMDSIGMLYNPPDMLGNNDSGVMWFGPMYRGVQSGNKVSTLGCLEIPLFFTSNNENFLGIRLYYDVVQSYVGSDNEVHYLDYGNTETSHNFHYTFVYMSYIYEYTQALGTIPYNIREKVVCAVPVYTITADFIQYDTQYRNYTYEPFKPYNWLSQEYKQLGVYGASQEQLNKVGLSMPLNNRSLAINNLTIREILLYDMSVNPANINTGGGNIGNVFSIIRLAFDSLTGLMAISIVPGISIGILFFLPLVLTIIIVIIKLVKR